MAKPITRIKFLSITRDIKEGRSVRDIAVAQHVSTATVNNIRRARTWPGFVLQKRQKTSYIANAKERKFAQAQRAGLNPVETTGWKRAVLTRTPEYITREEFEAAIQLLDSRLDVHNFVIQKKADKKERRRFWGKR